MRLRTSKDSTIINVPDTHFTVVVCLESFIIFPRMLQNTSFFLEKLFFLCSCILFTTVFCLVNVGITAEDYLPPSHPIPHTFFSHTNPLTNPPSVVFLFLSCLAVPSLMSFLKICSLFLICTCPLKDLQKAWVTVNCQKQAEYKEIRGG